jgi:diguanylate cyclase
VIHPWSNQAQGLDIEITEGALGEDAAVAIRRLKLLRSAGVRIAVDDFGTGYSCLSRLASLPIDTLKIANAQPVRATAVVPGKVGFRAAAPIAREGCQ